MNALLPFVVRHGYALVFVWVLIEQGGLPIPSAPLLLAAGALAGTGRLSFGLVVVLAAGAALISDFGWYLLGRRNGAGVLRWLCRISLEPDSCVRYTRKSLGKHGPSLLLVAKFIPGLNAMAAPLAVVIRMSRRRFVAYDAAGALLWVMAYTVTGYGLSGEIERAAAIATRMGEGLTVVLLTAFAGYAAWKYGRRLSLARQLNGARMTPEELKTKVDAGENLIIVDLRHALDVETRPQTLPGALHLDPASLEAEAATLPRDREIVLFCDCPNEASAAALALRLRALGVPRVHILKEGYEGWRSRGYPMAAASTAPA